MTELSERRGASAPTGTGPVAFGPGSLLWELIGDRRSELVLPVPTLMQTMHPVIGDALRRMPVALTDPWGRRTRSIDSVQLWIYGGDAATAEARRLIELHKPVRGRDVDGREYPALKPEVWAWVPLSAYPAMLTLCRLFGEPLSAADTVRLYDEVRDLARLLGVRERHIPATVADFWSYYDAMVAGRLVNHPHVHSVLAVARRPPPPPGLPGPLTPAWSAAAPLLGRLWVWLIRGTFPPQVREILGLDWTARDELLLRASGQAIRYLARVTPEPLRYFPMPRHARRLARARAAGRPTVRHEQRLARWQHRMRARHTVSLV
jgi:uncharacterized protein (DUF2236 family)